MHAAQSSPVAALWSADPHAPRHSRKFEGAALRISAGVSFPALRWEKVHRSCCNRRLQGQQAACGVPETISPNEREHFGFVTEGASQITGRFGERVSDSLEDEEEDQDVDAGSGAEGPGDDMDPEMFNDEEFQRLRRVEVSWKLQKLTKLGGPSKMREAEDEVAALEEEGIPMDAKLATDLINAYMRCGNNDLALAVFKTYFEDGDFQVDDVVVGVLLRGLGGGNLPDWPQISSVLGRMVKVFKLKPSVVVYNELLSICCKSNAIDKGMQIIEEMAAKGVAADYGTLASVKQKKSLRSHLKKVYSKF